MKQGQMLFISLEMLFAFQIFKCYDVINHPNMKRETYFAE